jgi:hypothetical protein
MVNHQAHYLIRCLQPTADGPSCPAMVVLHAQEKTQCPACGAVHPPWNVYLSRRSFTKSDARTC